MMRSTSSDPIVSEYSALTPASARSFTRARSVLAGGTSRATSVLLPHPLTIARARGANVIDEDGRDYIDLVNNHGSLIHGHAFAPIQEAVARQLECGATWSAGNVRQVELAELMLERIPDVDQLRFTNSGMEANNLAILIARTLTGRRKVLKAHAAYHGSLHEFMISLWKGDADPTGDILTAPFGDEQAFGEILASHGEEIAAVLLEPVHSRDLSTARPEFLSAVQRAASEAGSLFILDEVLTLRLAKGGYKELLGATCDLTTFGKIIGGGFSVGAVGGHADVMSVFDLARPRVFHSGTFNGHPVTMVAGRTALEHYGADEIERLDQISERVVSGITTACHRAGLPLEVVRVGSLLDFEFTDGAAGQVAASIDELLPLAAMTHGVFMTGRSMYLSTALDEVLADEVVDRVAAALNDVAAAV